MINQIHVGVKAADLAKATEFYSAIGFELNKNFSGPEMSQFKINKEIHMSLFAESSFMKNVPVGGIDANQFGLVSCALTLESQQAVDDLVESAVKAGGAAFETKNDNGFMYMNGFTDIDGNIWTVFYMKM